MHTKSVYQILTPPPPRSSWSCVVGWTNSKNKEIWLQNYIISTFREFRKVKKPKPLLPKAHLWLKINLHSKFQLPSSIWRRVMRGTNTKDEKNRWKKKHVSELWKGAMKRKSTNPQTAHLGPGACSTIEGDKSTSL